MAYRLLIQRAGQTTLFSKYPHYHFSLSCCSFQSTLEDAVDKHVASGGIHKLNLNFDDTKIAFASKKTSELLRAFFVYQLCSFNYLVDNNKMIMKVARQLFGEKIFHAAMHATFYGHFVAGEDQNLIKPLIQRNRQFGVKSILDYSVEDDIKDDEAKDKVRESLKEIVIEPNERPHAAPTKYKTSVEFANRSKDVVSARTFFYESERQCSKNMETFLKCIDAVSGSTKKEGFAVIKLTALGRPQILLQFSDFLVQMRNLFQYVFTEDTSNLPQGMLGVDKEQFKRHLAKNQVRIEYNQGKRRYTLMHIESQGENIDLLSWKQILRTGCSLAPIFTVKNKKTGEMEQLVPSLTEEGLEEMHHMMQRIDKVVAHAKASNVRLMVDAEQSYFQPAIRRIVMELMRVYNKELAIVFNTYQCYLKDSINQMTEDLSLAEFEDFYFGAKMVRGAYIEQERERANKLCYDDPINPSFEATTQMYEDVLEKVFQAISRRPKGKIAVMIASHNEDTIRHAVKRMDECGITPNDRLICFGQLLGMCDQISFTLGEAGYSVYKYVPYGPIDGVLPYLSRRALENKGVLAKTKKEQKLVLQEIFRRLKTGQILYKPMDHVILPRSD